MSKYIRSYEGVPPPIQFDSHEGTPLVLNVLTGILYYLHKGMVLPVQAGPIPSGLAFSSGFDKGFG